MTDTDGQPDNLGTSLNDSAVGSVIFRSPLIVEPPATWPERIVFHIPGIAIAMCLIGAGCLIYAGINGGL